MSKLGTSFTNLVATGADATAIATLVGCSLGCGGLLLAAGIIGLNVAAVLTDRKNEQDERARDAELQQLLKDLHARVIANDPTAFLHYNSEAQRTAAEALAQAL